MGDLPRCLVRVGGEAIDELIWTLRVPYDLASSLVWAEMSSPSVRLPD